MKIQLILFFLSYIFCKNSFAIPTGGQPYLPETNKRQAPDFGSDAVITKANCNQRESNGEKTVYDCYDGQQSQQVDSKLSGYSDAQAKTSISSYIQPPPAPSQLYEQPPPIPEASSSLGSTSASNSRSFGSPEVTKANCVTTTDGVVQENGKSVHKVVLMCKEGQSTGNPFGPKQNSKRKRGPTYLPKTKKRI